MLQARANEQEGLLLLAALLREELGERDLECWYLGLWLRPGRLLLSRGRLEERGRDDGWYIGLWLRPGLGPGLL